MTLNTDRSDLIVAEFANAAGITTAEAAAKLLRLTGKHIEQMARMAAELTAANVAAGMAGQAAVDAAHRRVGQRTGEAYVRHNV